MSKFSVVPLTDVCDVLSGGTPKTSVPEYWDGEIPWASVKDFNINSRWFSSTEKRISREGLESCSSVLLEPGELVISARGTVGVIAQPTMQTAFNQSNYGLKAKQGLADNDYLYYALVHANKALLGDTHGGMFDTITRSTLDRLLVPNPPLKEQRRIAEALGVFDEKIALNKELSKTLGNLAQSIFKSWFIDFDPVKANMSAEGPSVMEDETASLFPGAMEDSELGLIPKGWSVLRAGELFDIGIGRTPPRKEPEWFSEGNSGVPWVSIRDMGTFGAFSHSTSESLTEAAVVKFRVPVVPEKTVLMSFKLTVGKLCITDRPLVTNEAIAHFRVPIDGRLDSNYAYLWLSRYDMRTLDSTSSIGMATNSGVIRNIKFLVPSKEVLLRFQNTIDPIFKSLQSLQEQSTTLTHLRDALLPRLVSGELQIPEEMMAS